ncbi:unnamed protein product [Eruca vesicaria subsp. sativa]|uniref:Uncharacterized protein n=1 Tax=Eruca vesicaria subsp. sativa TaxID=29727 RepID=A0ABC8M1G7_ERUVS|nr:unnamed protein product [Eruca vesicaria subsp. sativa]
MFIYGGERQVVRRKSSGQRSSFSAQAACVVFAHLCFGGSTWISTFGVNIFFQVFVLDVSEPPCSGFASFSRYNTCLSLLWWMRAALMKNQPSYDVAVRVKIPLW